MHMVGRLHDDVSPLGNNLQIVGDAPCINQKGHHKSDPISLDTVSTTMTGAKEVDDGNEQAEADSWQ